jgi:hypothetical protein
MTSWRHNARLQRRRAHVDPIRPGTRVPAVRCKPLLGSMLIKASESDGVFAVRPELPRTPRTR